MSYYNEEERKAGAMLLSQLSMFNQAAVVFETVVAPAFWKGFDQCVTQFIQSNAFLGKSDIEAKDVLWIAPASWCIGEDHYKCWFENHQTPCKENDYLLAVLTRCATETTAFGFRLAINSSAYGGVRNLKNYAQEERSRAARDKLAAFGFEDQGKGNFFIPLFINIAQLSECWLEYGAFPVEHPVFEPLNTVLETLRSAMPLIDQILCPLEVPQ